MTITAALVKELRERTGLGMMECKNALVDTSGDIEKAIDNLRKSGQAKAAKKSGRTTAEGVILVKANQNEAAMVEINSETDFVARDENFLSFAQKVCAQIIASQNGDVASLMNSSIEGKSVEETRQALVQKIGENISVRRALYWKSSHQLTSYVHNGKIGVLIELEGGDLELAKDLAMHIAAVNPMVVNPSEVSADLIEKEKEIFSAQAKESGKPADIIEKMIGGRIQKFLAEVSLVEQGFIKDPNTKVSDLLKKANANVLRFVRFEVGEGIEKESVDFAAEVMAQAGIK